MCLEIFTLQSNSMIFQAKPRVHIIYKEQFRDQQLTIAKDLKCWSKILLINECGGSETPCNIARYYVMIVHCMVSVFRT